MHRGIYACVLAVMLGFGALGSAQEPAEVLTAAREQAPDPTADHVGMQDDLDRVTEAAANATRIERAQRIAPIDVLYGLPAASR